MVALKKEQLVFMVKASSLAATGGNRIELKLFQSLIPKELFDLSGGSLEDTTCKAIYT